MTIHGKITYSLNPDGFGSDCTYEIAEKVGNRIVAALREYLDTTYPGHDIEVITTLDTGVVDTQDFISDDEGNDLPDVSEDIESFLEKAFADPKYWS